MDEFVFVHKLQRAIKQQLAALSINVTSGGVEKDKGLNVSIIVPS